MSDLDPRTILMAVFIRLRQIGFMMGVGEFLAALQAAEDGWGSGGERELKQVARLLWCSTPEEGTELDATWHDVVSG